MKIVVAALCLALPGLALGAKERTKEAPATQRVKQYDFDADHIVVQTVGPKGEIITGRGPAELRGLIQPRAEFTKEIVKSAEDLL